MPAKGKHHTKETLLKMSEIRKKQGNFRLGTHHSEESKRKQSVSQTGKHWTLSAEAKENIRLGHIGLKTHTWSEESRRKLSESKKGKPGHRKGIPHTEESKKKMSVAQSKRKGPKAANWKGGISFEPYCIKFNNEFKERVRAFFGYKCVECGVSQTDKCLAIHHVNFNKKACCDDTIPLFVSLCFICHGRTQGNRDYWEKHFTNIINEQYGGKCYLSKDDPELTLKIVKGRR
jgi:hypothetical protein